MYFIACRFKINKTDDWVNGFAICSDPDTPETFIFPDGKPYTEVDIWDYKLQHTMPWACIEYKEP